MNQHLLASMVMVGLLVSAVQADVFNMPSGMTSLETVPVGNPGNAADTEVMTDGTSGYGRVDYAYRIGKYEVTAGQYTEFLNAVADTDTYSLYNISMSSSEWGCKIERLGVSGGYEYVVADDRADRPVNFVSWGDAARFCNWLHNGQTSGPQGYGTTEDGAYDLNGATSKAELMAIRRENDATWFIPTEDQWYKAAYHKNDGVTAHYWDYPTQANGANVPSNDLISPDPGNNANYMYGSGFTIGSPYWQTEVGEFENSESAYGTFDQGGNLWEWNDTAIASSSRGVRGGSWGLVSTLMHASYRYQGYGNSPTHETTDIGFRVAGVAAPVPEPSTLVLLALGVVGLLIGRRRR